MKVDVRLNQETKQTKVFIYLSINLSMFMDFTAKKSVDRFGINEVMTVKAT